jgi:phosphoribosyl-ATP pyrophosphohydrolase
MNNHRLEVLARLADTVAARKAAPGVESYTAKLLGKGVGACAKKLGEEAVETALAAVSGDRRQIAAGSADLLYHLVVMLAATGVDLADVMAELERREGTSGLAEKASRPKS